MPAKIQNLFYKFLSIFLIYSLPSLFIFFSKLSFLVILSSIALLLFITCIFCFYFITGVRLFQKPSSKLTITLVQISLLLQSCQFGVLGFHFENYYGPYLGIGFTDTPRLLFTIRRQFTYVWVSDGFNHASEIFLFINLFPILLMIIFLYFNRKNPVREVIKDNNPLGNNKQAN